MNCNICNNNSLDLVLSLPNYPLNSVYLKNLSDSNKYSPCNMDLYCCNNCNHFQLFSELPLDQLYNDDYNYNTKNSGVQGRIDFFLNQLNPIKSIKFNRVIEIGCFDLSLLKKLKQEISANYFIGIDPSIPIDIMNNTEDIICFKEYCDNVRLPHFNTELPDLVISDQTFEHIQDINKSLDSIINQVNKSSFFAVCVPSLEVLVEKLKFHNIIHEHVNYFSIHNLTRLFDNFKISLNAYTIEYNSTCGFLFALYSKNSNIKVDLPSNIYTKDYFFKYYNIFRSSIAHCNTIINALNKNIYGFGASDITPNLAYFMDTDFSYLINILDDTEYKQNTYFPFLKAKIINPLMLENINGANCLITAPHASRYLYKRLLDFGFKNIINPIGFIS